MDYLSRPVRIHGIILWRFSGHDDSLIHILCQRGQCHFCSQFYWYIMVDGCPLKYTMYLLFQLLIILAKIACINFDDSSVWFFLCLYTCLTTKGKYQCIATVRFC